MHRFRDRADAGRHLALQLREFAGRSDVVVLALPRGGVPVAAQVAASLGAPLDVFLVRKLGVPGHPELAMGAIAEGGIRVLSGELIRQLGIPQGAIEQVAVRERLELDRRGTLYRAGRPAPHVTDRTVILVDDGLATGATMEAAALALREHKPARIVIAAPVGAPETCARLKRVADTVVCASMPEDFSAVGLWYEDFDQTTDEEVTRLLAAAGHPGLAQNTYLTPDPTPLDLVRRRARRFSGSAYDYDSLVEAAGRARVVLIGEATHGTHEFYRERAVITKRLIVEQGFRAVAVEADWPDAYRVNRFVRGVGPDEDATDALADFKRFPSWMWRNADVLDFVGWLRTHNERLPADRRAGFYGLDLYSLHASMAAVIGFLDKVDPASARRARARYACFDRFGEEPQTYAQAAGLGWEPSCEREVVAALVDLRKQAAEYARRDGRLAADDVFVAEQNARVVRNAEAYYRTMFGGRVESWNLRDRHMAETLGQLMTHLQHDGMGPRVVVWAHNSHVGDARATEMGQRGELNIGQLARERWHAEALSVGFTTHTGTVTAATDWDTPPHRRHVRPSLAGSYERLFHEAGIQRFLLDLRGDLDLAAALSKARLERAIGVLYLPETERRSHYFHARLAEQFDFVIHIDESRAVEPLERTALWEAGEVAETYPSGL
jgi:erythromycin esterase-like protein/predicted phosphoribosyltransferase